MVHRGRAMLGKTLLEADVEKHFRKRSKLNRIWAVKIFPFNSKGFPDRLCLGENRLVFFVELKRPTGGKLSARQDIIHKLLKQFGFKVYVLTTKEEVNSFYEEKPFCS